jgi:hypothetical protein
MSAAQAGEKPPLGSLEWLERTGGRLTFADRLSILGGALGALGEGFRLARAARRIDRRRVALALLEPPDTPMVRASREHLVRHCERPMVNHSMRTAFWTLAVLHQRGELTPTDLETTWVAALLHDVGLEHPPEQGDFSLGGVQVLKALAHEHRWSEEQTHLAAQAIATNLATRVDPARVGVIAWAMNVGGLGELGFGPHRAQLHPERVAELEARFPRTEFPATAMRLIREETRRVPGGRFALLGRFFPLIMKP